MRIPDNFLLTNFNFDKRFFYICAGIVCLFIISFFLPFLFLPAKLVLCIFLVFLAVDTFILFRNKNGLVVERKLPAKLSNSDQNKIDIRLVNHFGFEIHSVLIDEIPEEFQVRDFEIKCIIAADQTSQLSYYLKPTFRGNVMFGCTIVFVRSPLGMVKRMFKSGQNMVVPVYPSFMQMNKYSMLAFSKRLLQPGFKNVRRLGHTLEFEKINGYVSGDDLRTVNWKATAKSNKLMVNQYEDQRAQSVYCIVDKGRVMKMPFEGLSLLDYAINTSLTVCNIVLKKQDYAGFFSFSRKVENRVIAEKKGSQMKRIMEALYNVKTDYYESDFGRLYADIRKNITHRSLLLLFTNFETLDGLNRQLPYLKSLSKNHLLIIIFFQNTELDTLIHQKSKGVHEIYDKIIAEKFQFEQRLIVNELRKYGIHSIVTSPAKLTVDTINKYLEIKARGMN